MPNLNAIPFCQTSDNDDAARCLQSSFAFNNGGSSPSVQTFKRSAADVGLNTIQSVYIDNSASPAPTSVTLGQTRQVITAAPFSQGFYPVLNSPLDIDFTIVNFGGVTAAGFIVGLHWTNVQMEPTTWLCQSIFPGTPYSISSQTTAGNVILSAIMTAQTGRRSFITGLYITGSGATAASIVTATLSNTDSGGAMNFQIVVPAGPTLPIVPVAVSFFPPLAVISGANCGISVPAFGSGNTNAAFTMTGFYL